MGAPGKELKPPNSFGPEGRDQIEQGVRTTTTMAPESGIGGAFGASTPSLRYSAEHQTDPAYAGNRAAIAQQLNNIAGRQIGQMNGAQMFGTQLNQGQADASRGMALQTRGQQSDLASFLRTQAMGQGGPTAAMAQLNAGTDRSLSAASSLAKSQRGGNQSVALKQALQAQGDTMQRVSNDAAILRAQEQQQAQQGLAGMLGQMQQGDQNLRAQDLGAATTNAQLAQQTNATNAQLQQDTQKTNFASQVDQQRQKDLLVAQYMQMGMSADQAKFQADLQQSQFNVNLLSQQAAADRGVAMQAQQTGTQVGMAGMSALASMLPILMSASDEREKTDIVDGKKDLHAFLDTVGTHKYRYKDPGKPLRGEGEFVSPMAQELEQTKLGQNLVKEAPDGTKIVDYGKGLGLFLSALSDQHKRLAKLEVKRG